MHHFDERVLGLIIGQTESAKKKNQNQKKISPARRDLVMAGLNGQIGSGLRSQLIARQKYLRLTSLEHGDLRFSTDFRSVYGTVLETWLHAPSAAVLGRRFPPLALV